jgi:hypothetical protein
LQGYFCDAGIGIKLRSLPPDAAGSDCTELAQKFYTFYLINMFSYFIFGYIIYINIPRVFLSKNVLGGFSHVRYQKNRALFYRSATRRIRHVLYGTAVFGYAQRL